MTKLRRLLSRISALFRRSYIESDFDAEIQSHLEMQAEDHRRNGLNEDEARRAALRDFGGVVRTRERYRESYSFHWIESVVQDFRYGLRTLRKNPGFTAVAITMLALGIGINTAVFTVTNAVLFTGYPHIDPTGRILYLDNTNAAGQGMLSYPDFEYWSSQTKSFTELAGVGSGIPRILLSDEGLPDTYDANELTANAFKVLGKRPLIGRDFAASDCAPGAFPVTILSYELWVDRYAKDPAVITRTVRINDVATAVIGVMPQDFEFPLHKVDLWLPLVPTRAPLSFPTDADVFRKPQAPLLWFAFGRLADGVSLESARTEMKAIGSQLALAYPEANQDLLPRLRTFSEKFIGPNATKTYGTLWGAVGFLLLIACANLANLMLARAIGRTRETSLRSALGAARSRIIQQLVIESLILSCCGGAIGLGIALWGVHAYETVADPPSSYAHWVYVMDYHVFAYVLAVSIVAGLLFGLVPALRLARMDLNARLKDGGRGSVGGRQGTYLSALLVIGEMALAVVLLAAAGLMIHSFLKVYTADWGAQTGKVLTASVRLPKVRYPDADARIRFFDRLTPRLKTLPGVESIALTDALPGLNARAFSYEVAGTAPVDEGHRPTLPTVTISPDYFRALGASVISGRAFSEADGPAGIQTVIVNRRLADVLWPGKNPLGQRLRFFDGNTPDTWRSVVGVVSDIVQDDPTGQKFEPVAYVPYKQRTSVTVDIMLARTRVPPGSLTSLVRREIRAIDADLFIYSGLGSIAGPRTLNESLEFNYWSSGINAGLFFLFAAIGLIMAALGLYAVIAHSVTQHTQEIGIRIALGASARDIVNMVLKLGMLPLAIGLAIGLAASVAVNRVLQSQLIGVSSSDPIALLSAVSVLVLSGLLGCGIPARRATRVDPIVALRHE